MEQHVEAHMGSTPTSSENYSQRNPTPHYAVGATKAKPSVEALRGPQGPAPPPYEFERHIDERIPTSQDTQSSESVLNIIHYLGGQY